MTLGKKVQLIFRIISSSYPNPPCGAICSIIQLRAFVQHSTYHKWQMWANSSPRMGEKQAILSNIAKKNFCAIFS